MLFLLQLHFVSPKCRDQAAEAVLVIFLSFVFSISENYNTGRTDCRCPFFRRWSGSTPGQLLWD